MLKLKMDIPDLIKEKEDTIIQETPRNTDTIEEDNLLHKRNTLEDTAQPDNNTELNSAEKVENLLNDQLEKIKLEDQIKNMHDFEFIFDREENYKKSYYKSKFDVNKENYFQFLQTIKKSYIEGIVWNYKYYYQGCVSWDWYYPFYYAPLLSDLYNFSHFKFEFNLSVPFRPIEQLLAVLPPYSSHALPDAFKPLMLKDTSEIIDFYPENFKVDVRGKRFAWLGEVILPFIDGKRLIEATKKHYHKLTADELRRNKDGKIILFTEREITNNKLPVGKKEGIEEKEVFTMDEFKVDRESLEKINHYTYELPQYQMHLCEPLSNTDIPKNPFSYIVS